VNNWDPTSPFRGIAAVMTRALLVGLAALSACECEFRHPVTFAIQDLAGQAAALRVVEVCGGRACREDFSVPELCTQHTTDAHGELTAGVMMHGNAVSCGSFCPVQITVARCTRQVVTPPDLVDGVLPRVSMRCVPSS